MRGLLDQSSFKTGTFYIPHLDFSNNQLSNTLTVSNDIFILTDKITLGPVNLNGEGKLTIYVSPGKETFNVQDNGVTFGRSTNQEKLEIYVDSFEPKKANDYHVTFSNNSTTHAYLMFANARVGFGQNAKLNGAIYTGATDSGKMYAILLSENAEITSGNQKALLVAPSGTVYMSNNSNLRGAVIAQDFVMGNGSDKTYIAFDPDFPQNIPFDITTPIQVQTPGGNNRQLTIHQTKER